MTRGQASLLMQTGDLCSLCPPGGSAHLSWLLHSGVHGLCKSPMLMASDGSPHAGDQAFPGATVGVAVCLQVCCVPAPDQGLAGTCHPPEEHVALAGLQWLGPAWVAERRETRGLVS